MIHTVDKTILDNCRSLFYSFREFSIYYTWIDINLRLASARDAAVQRITWMQE